MTMWQVCLDYEGTTDPGSLVVNDVPLRWVLAVGIAVMLCGRRWHAGRLGFRLLQWAARREEAASVEVFRVKLDPGQSQRVRVAIEAAEEAP